MSRYLCKLAKGVLALHQIIPVEDGENNLLHALHVHTTHHWAGVTVDFHEAALNHIGCLQLPPEGPRTREGREQLGEIAEQPCRARRIRAPPPRHLEQIAELLDPDRVFLPSMRASVALGGEGSARIADAGIASRKSVLPYLIRGGGQFCRKILPTSPHDRCQISS